MKCKELTGTLPKEIEYAAVEEMDLALIWRLNVSQKKAAQSWQGRCHQERGIKPSAQCPQAPSIREGPFLFPPTRREPMDKVIDRSHTSIKFDKPTRYPS